MKKSVAAIILSGTVLLAIAAMAEESKTIQGARQDSTQLKNDMDKKGDEVRHNVDANREDAKADARDLKEEGQRARKNVDARRQQRKQNKK